MFCTNCGNALDDDSLFCANCGHKITDQERSLAANSNEAATVTQKIGCSSLATHEDNSADDGTESLEPLVSKSNASGNSAEETAALPNVGTNTTYVGDKTEVMNPDVGPQPQVPQGIPHAVPIAGATPAAQAAAQPGTAAAKTTSKSDSNAFVVTIIIAAVIVVIVGILLALTILKPPIDFLKDTPFSSVKTETVQPSDSNSNTDSDSKKDSSSDSKKGSSSSDSDSKKKSESESNKKSDSSSKNSSSSKKYIVSNSGTTKLTSSDLAGLTDDELCIAQNEIWARYGRKFKNNWLQEYFDSQSWYHGTVDPDDFTKQKIGWSDVEEANASLISNTLSSRGYDVNAVHPN